MSLATHTLPGGVPFHTVDWTKDDEIAAFVKDVWQSRPAQQVQMELLAELTEAWYRGDQYLWHASTGGTTSFRIEPIPNPDDRVRMMVNYFAPLLDQYVARTTLDPVEPEATPTGTSEPDLDACRAQTTWLRYYRDYLDLGRLKDDMGQLIAFGGLGFGKVTWDPLAGSEFELSAAELETLQLDGDPLEQGGAGRTVSMGELCVENVPLRNLTWGPVGLPFRKAEYVLEGHERSFGYVIARYGLKADDLKPAYADARELWYRNEFTAQGSTVYDQRRGETVLVFELWAPRSAAHPAGLHVVLVNDQVVNRKRNAELANPYDDGRVPYVPCDCLRVRNSPWPKTPAWDMFDPQAMINFLVSRGMEAVDLNVNPSMWGPEDNGILASDVAGKGGYFTYKNKKPEALDRPDLPPSWNAMFDRWVRAIQNCIGVQDVSLGKAPSNGRSGRFVQLLQSADDTRMDPTRKNLARWTQDVFRLILCRIRQFVSEERMIAVRGADNAWERRALSGKQLVAGGTPASGPEAFNVTLKTAGAARSRAAQTDLIITLIQFNFFDPKDPADRQLVLTVLELGDSSGRLDRDQQDREAQRRVHEILVTGRYVPPAWYHNHVVRTAELLHFMNGEDFKHLSPEVQANFERYYKDTIRIQAVQPLIVGQLGGEAKLEWERKQAADKQLAQLENQAGPQTGRMGALLNGPRGEILRNFLAGGGNGMPAPAGPPPGNVGQPRGPMPLAPAAA
ncbi:MAG: hypothetical protein PHU85_00320 [Phycisphaerae bacterium]|nr:hypothetical protein [Phycisphaerae bacterium]